MIHQRRQRPKVAWIQAKGKNIFLVFFNHLIKEPKTIPPFSHLGKEMESEEE
ncbi:MAG: hypothetical protein CM15mP49_22550 [Actinomycetota bacterium]|nr:MAG: hypothetical protein CM15mP49_22550 [Actinomycetota bacterium]